MSQNPSFSILPLGGCGEIGMNMTVLFAGQETYFIDCGALFPDASQPGVQLILPGFSWLVSAGIKPDAWLITHGHEDHIGGLPYFFPRFPAPIYTSSFAAALIEGKFKDLGVKKYDMKVWKDGERTRIGKTTVTPFEVNHSIPCSMGLWIESPHGSLLHTGDFRIDKQPFESMTTDARIKALLGRKRPDLMISDSTNSFVKGVDLSEKELVDDFFKIFRESPGAVVVASFSSNIWRAQTVIDAARASSRAVHLLGRGTRKNFGIAEELGLVETKGVEIVDEKDLKKFPREKICVLCTGSQGEPFSGLHRLAYNSVSYFSLDEGDTVMFSARAIPGNEKAIIFLTNQLCRLGVQVVDARDADIHVSGHGFQEDLKRTIQVAKPRNFMPVHGEYRHLKRHRELAVEVGVPLEHTILAENGCRVSPTKTELRLVEKVPAPRSYVSQGGIYHDEGQVYRSRSQLAKNGLVCVSLVLGRNHFQIKGRPAVACFGVPMQEEILEDAVPSLAEQAEDKVLSRKDADDDDFADELRVLIRRYVETYCRFKTLVKVQIHRLT